MTTETCQHCRGSGQVQVNLLRVLRERDKLKGGDVADHLGLSQSAYSRLETAAGKPGGLRWSKHLRGLADLYKVTTDQLLGREPLMTVKKARPARPPDPRSLARSDKAKKEKSARQRRRRS